MSADNNKSMKNYPARNAAQQNEMLSSTSTYQGKAIFVFYSGYLSWMRNTYIMTVAGVAMLHSEVAPLAPIAGTGKHGKIAILLLSM